jgi:hypothetical protein
MCKETTLNAERPPWLLSLLLGPAILVVCGGVAFGLMICMFSVGGDGPGPNLSWAGLSVGTAIALASVGVLSWYWGPGRRSRQARRLGLLVVAGAYVVTLMVARIVLT